MKKIIAVSACFIFLLALVSCSSCSSCVSCNKKAGLNEQITEKDPYEAIIEKYTELLKEKKSSDTELTVPDDANDTEKVLYDIVNSCDDPSLMGYAAKDINRDGENELVLMTKACFVHALFTQKNGEPVLLLSQQSRMEILPDGTVYAYKFVPNTSSHIQLKKSLTVSLRELNSVT